MRSWVLLGCAAVACSFDSSPGASGSGTDSPDASTTGEDDISGSSMGGGGSMTTTGASAGATTTSASSDTPEPSSTSTASGESDADAASSSESESDSATESDTVDPTTGPDGPALGDDGLVVRYFLDEAPAGDGPLLAMDWADDPLNLPLEYVEATMHYVSEGPRRGLAFDQAGDDDAARGMINGTKVAALEGTYELTVEAVVRVDDAVGSGSRIVHIGRNSVSAITLAATGPDELQARWNGVTVRNWDFSDYQGASHVVHLVVDTTAVNAMSQFRLLVDGIELSPEVVGNLPKDAPLEFEQDPILALGNRHQDRTFRGVLFYAAIYDYAISDSTVAEHVEALQISDDSPE